MGRPGTFPKGKSGNPKGRPQLSADLARKICEKDTDHRLRLEYIAAHGNERDSIAAIKLLWAYGHGNPAQPITGEDGGAIKLDHGDLLAALQYIAKLNG